ncbi:hypothetical protein MXC99_10770 [Thauera aromatica]|uniref:hypothetical protein n=1 Tax=Thauera aromatica TaxID=59405 RepID=UPI001FFC3499|nr:hypothetical protein [Thauera aromatica]MCK2088653.1 hypothetical protein [Thauera aromatica]
MADLQRLIRSALWFAVWVLISAVPMLAFAEGVTLVGPITSQGNFNSTCDAQLKSIHEPFIGYWAPTMTELLALLSGSVSAFTCGGATYPVTKVMQSTTKIRFSYATSNNAFSSYVDVVYSFNEVCDLENGYTRNVITGQCEEPPPPPECGPNSYFNNNLCYCNRGYETPTGGASYVPGDGGSCVSYCDQTIGNISIFTTTNTTSGVCMMGCWYNRESVVGGSNCSLSLDISADANSPATYRCSMAGTGQHCDNYGQGDGSEPPAPEPEPPPPEPEPEPEPCKAGFQTVSVNGISSCVKSPPPIDNVDQAQQTTTNPDGTTTTTNKTTTTKVNDDGTVTKTTNTETTTKDQAGNTISSGTSSQSVEQGLEGFCEDNPTSSICGEQPGLFDGDCQGEIKCEGDALQCAIAASTFKTQCALSVTDDVKDAFQQMIDYDGTGEGEGLDRREIEVSQLDVSISGGGAGLADQSFSIMGKTIVLPFSQLNSILAFFGYAVMMIAWLQAYKIIREAF